MSNQNLNFLNNFTVNSLLGVNQDVNQLAALNNNSPIPQIPMAQNNTVIPPHQQHLLGLCNQMMLNYIFQGSTQQAAAAYVQQKLLQSQLMLVAPTFQNTQNAQRVPNSAYSLMNYSMAGLNFSGNPYAALANVSLNGQNALASFFPQLAVTQPHPCPEDPQAEVRVHQQLALADAAQQVQPDVQPSQSVNQSTARRHSRKQSRPEYQVPQLELQAQMQAQPHAQLLSVQSEHRQALQPEVRVERQIHVQPKVEQQSVSMSVNVNISENNIIINARQLVSQGQTTTVTTTTNHLSPQDSNCSCDSTQKVPKESLLRKEKGRKETVLPAKESEESAVKQKEKAIGKDTLEPTAKETPKGYSKSVDSGKAKQVHKNEAIDSALMHARTNIIERMDKDNNVDQKLIVPKATEADSTKDVNTHSEQKKPIDFINAGVLPDPSLFPGVVSTPFPYVSKLRKNFTSPQRASATLAEEKAKIPTPQVVAPEIVTPKVTRSTRSRSNAPMIVGIPSKGGNFKNKTSVAVPLPPPQPKAFTSGRKRPSDENNNRHGKSRRLEADDSLLVELSSSDPLVQQITEASMMQPSSHALHQVEKTRPAQSTSRTANIPTGSNVVNGVQGQTLPISTPVSSRMRKAKKNVTKKQNISSPVILVEPNASAPSSSQQASPPLLLAAVQAAARAQQAGSSRSQGSNSTPFLHNCKIINTINRKATIGSCYEFNINKITLGGEHYCKMVKGWDNEDHLDIIIKFEKATKKIYYPSRTELEIHELLTNEKKDEYILPVYHKCTYVGHNALVTKYFEHKKLNELMIENGGNLSDKYAAEIFSQVVSALEIFHSKSWVHRNLCPRAIWVGANNKVVIGELGDMYINMQQGPFNFLAIKNKYLYHSPAMLKGKATHQTADDVWSLGVVIYEALVGRRPFEGDSPAELVRNIENGQLELPISLSEDSSQLISVLLCPQDSRPTIEQVKAAKWIRPFQTYSQPMSSRALRQANRRN